MKKKVSFIKYVVLICGITGCSFFQNKRIELVPDSKGQLMEINFEFGAELKTKGWKNIYAIWIEDSLSGYIQNILVCKKLYDYKLASTALPYWKGNVFCKSDKAEIDAVTSATRASCDFSILTALKDTSIRKFNLYFEVDRSFDPNDWFKDQPAVLYMASINLSDTVSNYKLEPIGWTPNEKNNKKVMNSVMPVLNKELRYITCQNRDGDFGEPDSLSSLNMVNKITVDIISQEKQEE